MRRRLLLLTAGSVVALLACDTDDGRQLREPSNEQRAAMTTTTTSTTLPGLPPDAVGPGAVGAASTTLAPVTPAPVLFTLQAPWPTGSTIDVRFTCDGEERSPALTWTAPPVGTVELALLVTDDDADGFVHWAVAGIPAAAGAVSEDGAIAGGIEGVNDFGTPGWAGPCPPSGLHLYRFSLYALDQQAELPDGYAADELVVLANASALAVAEVTGTYQRP